MVFFLSIHVVLVVLLIIHVAFFLFISLPYVIHVFHYHPIQDAPSPYMVFFFFRKRQLLNELAIAYCYRAGAKIYENSVLRYLVQFLYKTQISDIIIKSNHEGS